MLGIEQETVALVVSFCRIYTLALWPTLAVGILQVGLPSNCVP